MPAYAYKCPKCDWAGTRYNIAIARRDSQVCEEWHDQLPERVLYDERGKHESPRIRRMCLTKLERDEIPETGALPGQWHSWNT